MRVLKRGHRGYEEVQFDKITNRLRHLCYGLDQKVIASCSELCFDVIKNIFDGISTDKLDEISARIAESRKLDHTDYGILASRICVSNLHKSTPALFSEAMQTLQDANNMFNDYHMDFIIRHKNVIDKMIIHENDFKYDYFGFKTLEYGYMHRIYKTIDEKPNDEQGIICDRPQYMLMRVAIALFWPEEIKDGEKISAEEEYGCLEEIKAYYKLMSQRYFTHATPTNFNALCKNQQMLSCFLLGANDDIESIMHTLSSVAKISKRAGGIGVHMSNIRSRGSWIKSTRGRSSGLLKQLKLHDANIVCWDQGGRRKGSAAVYIEPWHADFIEFIQLKLQNGKDEVRARNLFYALWVPDLLMKRAEQNLSWSFFSEDTAQNLSDVYGDEFEKLYESYEQQGLARGSLSAKEILNKIFISQRETGGPYICYKDHVNNKSNQKNIGTIKSSNLCVAPETYILTDNGQIQISTLENQEVNVWNGKQFSPVVVRKTGENQELIKVTFSNYSIIECTKYHKFYIKRLPGIAVMASELKIFDELETWTDPDGKQRNQIILNIEETGRISDTYCFNEQLEHKGIFNGILTGNCAEINEVSTADSFACCTLASINLTAYVNEDNKTYNYQLLHDNVKLVTRALDRVVDRNSYPVPECVKNNLAYRPLGIGIQGLADVFCKLRIPFVSSEARKINIQIMETIYHAAVDESTELASLHGKYSAFDGSPASQGKLQFDLWDEFKTSYYEPAKTTGMWDWDITKLKIKQYGMRNSLLVALMPTASTSQILGNQESFEPFSSNIYTRSVLGGHYVVANMHMIKHLDELGLWNKQVKERVMSNKGSIQNIDSIPNDIKEIYKTVWEIPQSILMEMSADRGSFVDQSQSLNIYLADATDNKLYGVMSKGWKLGLKTGSYYIRTMAAAEGVKMNAVELKTEVKVETQDKADEQFDEEIESAMVCRREEGCLSCGA